MAQTFKPPATQRVYDVCVVGSHLGGAVAGAILARRGFRVLHIGHDGFGATYSDGGYALPYAPAMLPSPRAFPAAEIALTELGLATDLARQLEPCVPDLQILLPRHRLDLSRDAAVRVAELKREWPSEAERLEQAVIELLRSFDAATPFMKAMPPLPPDGFGERRAVSKAVRFAASAPGAAGAVDRVKPFEGLEAHPFVRALSAARRFLGYLDGEPSPLATTRLLGAALRGTYRLPGGYEALRESMRKKIAESRGEILGGDGAPAVAEAFDLDGSKVASVRLAGSPNAYVARAFIAATDAPAMRRLLSGSTDAKLGALLDRMRPRRQLLAVNLIVKAAALPPALGENVLALRDPEGTDAAENAVHLQILPARRDAKKGSPETVTDERVVCAAGFVEADARERGKEHLASAAQRIREVVADAIPFFDRHLVRESVPALAPGAEAGGSRLLPHPLYDVELESTLGVTGLPARSPYKNLVFAGREVVPGLGIEGEFHAGVQAAQAVAAMLGRKELLK